jgi:fatty-acyl-CoA synthase
MIYIGELLRYLVNQAPVPEERGHRMQRILGNGLRPDIWPAFRERFDVEHIREFYASTEGNAVTLNLDDVPGSVGKAVLAFADNTVLVRYDVEADDYLRDAKGFCLRCGPGEVGEMLGKVKVTTPFYGYTSEEDTRKKILRDVFAKGDAYFRTGDLVRKDAEGFYYFVDRIGDTYRWKGENVATQEVQEMLGSFAGTNLVSVYGVRIPGADGRVGMAAILMKAGLGFDPQAFYRHAVERLAPFAVPAFVRLVEEMDITGTFKLRKTELQAQGFDPAYGQKGLFWLDRERETYAPLEAETFRRIQAGEVRF